MDTYNIYMDETPVGEFDDEAYEVEFRVVPASKDDSDQQEAVVAGLGVALVPRHAVYLELAHGLLRELPVQELPLYRSWCVVHPRSKRLSPVAQAFFAFIRGERARISELAARFDGPSASPPKAD